MEAVDFLALIIGLAGAYSWLFYVPGIADLREGEQLVRKGKASLSINSLLGSGAGNLYLTNQRLIWRRPFLSLLRGPATMSQSIALRDITYAIHCRENPARGIPLIGGVLGASSHLTLEVGISGNRLFIAPTGLNLVRFAKVPADWIRDINTARRDPESQAWVAETDLRTPSEADMRRHGLVGVGTIVLPLAIITVFLAVLDSEAILLVALVGILNMPAAWLRWRAYKAGRPQSYGDSR